MFEVKMRRMECFLIFSVGYCFEDGFLGQLMPCLSAHQVSGSRVHRLKLRAVSVEAGDKVRLPLTEISSLGVAKSHTYHVS